MGERPALMRNLGFALYALASQRVWAYLEAQPGFNEGLRRAEAELAAGKGIPYEVVRGRLRKVRATGR